MAAMTAPGGWTPQEQGLLELIELFKKSQSAFGPHQGEIADRLDTLSQIPDYANYLVFTLTRVTSEDVAIRSVAGLILKNHLHYNHARIPPESIDYVKASILDALSFEEDLLRRTATQVVSMLMGILGPANWQEGLEKLITLSSSGNLTEAEGAYSTFAKMCEDMSKELDECEINGMKVLDILIPKFIEGTDHPEARIRVHALNCLNQFITLGSSALQNHLDSFIGALFKRASDDNDYVRRFVCQALVLTLSARPDKLLPELPNVVEFMLYSTQDKDEDVAVEACEFWLQFAEDGNVNTHLVPYIAKVAPVLLKSMVYNEMDLILLGGEDDDAAVPDRVEDLKPKHYSGKSHRNEHVEDASNTGASGSTGKSRAAIEGQGEAGNQDGDDEYDDDDDDEYDDDDDDDDDDELSEWNLRKCAAAALDVMACIFGDQLLEVLLPYLKDRLFSDDWLQRESGILALGAIAEGCITGIQPHLPTLVPYLVGKLSDSKPLVRSIACWTLGRYSSWCVAEKTAEHQRAYFLPVMESLLNMVMDNNKRVQEAGCSAFATLEEEAGADLTPFLEPVLRTLAAAFAKYQQKNLLILYDAIGTLADSVGLALNRPEYVEILMPPLIAKWGELPDDDGQLIPLLECLSSVTIALGPAFASHSPPVYSRCLKIIRDNLVAAQQEAEKPEDERDLPDDSFVVVALDLLSGLSQGLGRNVTQLIASDQSSPQLIPLLGACITSYSAPVRQSAYALLGDLSVSAFELLHPTVPSIMPELISQIEPEPSFANVSVCNNAAWAAGEIALQYGALADASASSSGSGAAGGPSSSSTAPNTATPKQPPADFAQFVEPLIQKLIPVLLSPKSVKSLTENSAVTIGRLGLVAPTLVAPHLEIFFESWCQSLWDIKDNEEKDSAFRGLCEMIKSNPNGAVKGFIYFCNAVVRWTTPSRELNDMFSQILFGFKEMSGDQGWDGMKSQLPEPIAVRLRERYNI
ncbi:unnamed protein product [Parajaminaea phylloscopi]